MAAVKGGRYDFLNKDMNEVMKLLVESDSLMRLMSPGLELISNPSNYIYKSIFPYKYDPSVKDEAGVYISVTFSNFRKSGNIFKAGTIFIAILCHHSLISVDVSKNRLFSMICEIDKIMNKNDAFGISDLDSYSLSEIDWFANYNGYALGYNSLNWN